MSSVAIAFVFTNPEHNTVTREEEKASTSMGMPCMNSYVLVHKELCSFCNILIVTRYQAEYRNENEAYAM